MNNFVLSPFQSFDCLEIKQSFLCRKYTFIFCKRKPRSEARIFSTSENPATRRGFEELNDVEEVAIFDVEIGFLHQATDFANLTIKY